MDLSTLKEKNSQPVGTISNHRKQSLSVDDCKEVEETPCDDTTAESQKTLLAEKRSSGVQLHLKPVKGSLSSRRLGKQLGLEGLTMNSHQNS